MRPFDLQFELAHLLSTTMTNNKATLDQDPSSSSTDTFIASNQRSNNNAFAGSQGGNTTTTATSIITPFSLANDDDADGYSAAESHRVSLDSITDGIDILAAEPSPSNFRQWSRQRSGRLVTNRHFKRAVLAIILVNSLLLGVRTWEVVRNNDRLADFLDNVLLRGIQLWFTLEIALEVVHYQRRTLEQGWVLFDLVIISTSWLLSPTLTVLRSFRLIRALRKASGVAALGHLVKALLKAVPKMLGIVFLVLFLFYIFAVMFTNFFQDIPEEDLSQDYFGSLDKSTYTLFQIMTLDNWTVISEELTSVYRWAWLPIVSFIVSSTFFFGSLAIAVVTEAVASVGNERLWKTLEIRESASPHFSSERGSGGPGTSGIGRKELYRLEEKVDDLRKSVDHLVRMQEAMQETLMLLQQQELARGVAQASTKQSEKTQPSPSSS
jgi:voltage-gated sodium channel